MFSPVTENDFLRSYENVSHVHDREGYDFSRTVKRRKIRGFSR
jgi:hypothetical protein